MTTLSPLCFNTSTVLAEIQHRGRWVHLHYLSHLECLRTPKAASRQFYVGHELWHINICHGSGQSEANRFFLF